ncbi:MAG TPA: hypothetical protein VFX03_14675, partial [Thermomicrobiales bacterium]|nr:hypothetical protein [Thermomicrobiales bacterium]
AMGDAVVRFPFDIHRMEYLGAERLLYGEIGDARVVARFPSTSTASTEAGRTVEFAVHRRDLKLFDEATGLRVDRTAR